MNCVPAYGAVVGAEHGAAVGLAQQLDVLQAEEEAVGGGARQDERLGRRLGLLQRVKGYCRFMIQCSELYSSSTNLHISGYFKDYLQIQVKKVHMWPTDVRPIFAWLQSDTFLVTPLEGHAACVAIFIAQNHRPYNRDVLYICNSCGSTIFSSSLLAMKEDAEVSDGEHCLRLEPGEVLPALGHDHGVAPRVALEHVDLYVINK